MAEKKTDPVAFVQAAIASDNIADQIPDEKLRQIAEDCLSEYKLDRSSMGDWLDSMERGIKLAKLVKEERTYPFPNCANTKYPLITSAALQFNARAYPAICAPSDVVKARVHGADIQGTKAKRGERVSAYQSWQLSAEIEEWEEGTDKLLVQLPIVGTMVRKVWYDAAQGRIRCRVIEPGKFIVNDNVTVLNDAPRCSEELSLFPSEIEERVRSGLFLNTELEDPDTEDRSAPHEFIEQHCRIDLDRDGYDEPYIVTVHRVSEKVVRVVADFEEKDVAYQVETEIQETISLDVDPETGLATPIPVQQEVEVPVGIKSIRRGSYFVGYQFMPNMEGKFHGTGLGILLGDISESINSILNMMLDAGHMSSLGGGFIGRDLRLKGGAQRFKPGEWRQVGANGAMIKDSIVPVSFPQPDATLFQLLGMLIDAGREIASVQDVITGDSGQSNMTATATIALIEQGMTVFTAAYKRIFRALKSEFKLIAKINAETVDPERYNQFHDEEAYFDPAEDFGAADMDIEPVADPGSVTKMQKVAKAEMMMQMAERGLIDMGEAAKAVIEAADLGDPEELAPKPNPQAEQMAQMQMQAEQMGAQAGMIKAQADAGKAEADTIKAQAEAQKLMQPEAVEDKTLDYQKLNTEAQLDSARMAQEAQLERERIASQERIAGQKLLVDVQVEELKARAQIAGRSEGESGAPEQKAVLDGFSQLIAMMQAQMELANGPKEVVRDESGLVVGVRPVVQ